MLSPAELLSGVAAVILLLFCLPIWLVAVCSSNKEKTKRSNNRSETLQSRSCSNDDETRPRDSRPPVQSNSGSRASKDSREDEEITDPSYPVRSVTKKADKKKLEGEDPRAAWTRYTLERSCRRLAKVYQKKLKLKRSTATSKEGTMPSTAHDANPQKNRYSDVGCFDATRVVLHGRENDYIHASWFSLPDNSVRFICAQGPLHETLEDFWYMIYQEKTHLVVMLCQLQEGNVEKCALYWPQKEGEQEKFGEMTVSYVEQRPEPVKGVGLTYLDVQRRKEPPFRVWHVLVSWWPDQLAPVDASPMLEVHRWVRKNNEKNAPILVHCSAGVGRTATFVGLDYATQRIKEDYTVEMADIVREMRIMRAQAIQSHVQFIFLHILVFEQFIQEGVIKKDEKLMEFLSSYQKVANKKLKKREEECAKEGKGGELVRKATRDEVDEN